MSTHLNSREISAAIRATHKAVAKHVIRLKREEFDRKAAQDAWWAMPEHDRRKSTRYGHLLATAYGFDALGNIPGGMEVTS